MDSGKKNIEAIYPLSPMQQTVLVDSLMPGFDSGFLQLVCEVRGNLNEDRLRRAWQLVLDAHGALRTSLHWRDLAEPLQIVRKQLVLPWVAEDLSSLADEERDEAIAAYLHEDRASGLDLATAPTFRVAFFRTGATHGKLVWTCHHALIDGWSGSLVVRAVVRAYAALANRSEPPRLVPRDYRDYVRWLAEQDPGKQERFWRVHLDGIAEVGRLPFLLEERRVAGGSRFEKAEAQLEQRLSADLRAYCRRQRVTVATLYHAAWAVVLSAASSMARHVVFGATVSGRDIELQGVEDIVGLFINTIPVKVRVEATESFSDFARRLQTEQTAARRFAYVPPDRIQEAADVPPRKRLYESLVVVENYPSAESQVLGNDNGITISGFEGGITTNYPLTLVVGPGEATELHLIFDPRRASRSTAEELLSLVVTMFEILLSEADQSVADLVSHLDLDELLRAGGRDSVRSPVTQTPLQDASASVSSQEKVPHVEPRTDTEKRIASLWQSLLGTNRAGVHDDFFDLGGQSVLALRLIKELDLEFETRIPLAALFDTPTIAHIASLIDGEQPEEATTLVAMRRDGSGTPVVCVHSWSGDPVFYRGIATTLDGHPVYGLQAPGLDGNGVVLDSIEDLADHHVQVILDRWPDEPVALVGRCLSGPLILEMAARIEERGGRVAAVINLDSGRPSGLPPRIRARYTGAHDPDPVRPKDMTYYFERAKRLRRERGLFGMIKDQVGRNVVGRVATALQPGTEADEVSDVNGNIEDAGTGGAGEDPVPAELGVLDDPLVAAVVEGLSNAWLQYEQRSYSGVLTLIRSTETAENPGKDWHVSHWKRYVHDVRVHVVDGLHQTMLLEPEVAEVSRVIRMTLDQKELEAGSR